MKLWKQLQLLLPWRRRAADREMRDELASIAAMAKPGELGNLSVAAELARDEWRWVRLEEAWQDVRYAVRTLRKSPAFSLTVVLSLALGIGANTALFTVTNAISWRLLPVRDPEHLFLLDQRTPQSTVRGFTFQQYSVIRDNTAALDFASYSPISLNVSIDGPPEPTTEGLLVSGGYFPLLGVRPALGRLLGPDDDRVPRGHPVAMISEAYWKSRFNRDPNVIGRQIRLSGAPFTIVGVTPSEFFGIEVGTAPKIFVPVMMQPIVMPVAENLLESPIQFVTWLRVLVRPHAATAMARATDEFARLALDSTTDWRPSEKFGGGRIDATIGVTPAATGLSDLRAQFSSPLRILVGVVLLVLLIACANTGNLMLARSATRRAEFAIRLALGAGRLRLIRQVLTEGLVLAGIAGMVGVVVAYWTTRALVAYVTRAQTALSLDLSPDGRVLGFTAAISVLAGLFFAVTPALRAARVDMAGVGAGDLRRQRTTVGASQPGRALVVLQVALSLVLLIGAGLFARSLQHLNQRQADIAKDQVLVVRVEPRGSDQRNIPGTTDRLDRVYRDLLVRVRQIPGVASASLARTSPLSTIGFGSMVSAFDTDVPVPTLMIYPQYFATMGQAVLKGRDLSESDLLPDSPQVAVVNEAFVRDVLKGREPAGDGDGAMFVMPGRPPQRVPFTIVGVVKDSPYPNLRERPSPMLYQTFRQARTGRGQMVLHVRVTGDTGSVAASVRQIVQAIDPDLPMFTIHTLADEANATLVRERLIALLSGFFGLLALALVCVGLYGLLSFSVAQRTAEIGVRMALGAARGNVAWLVVRQTLILVGLGIAIGLPLVWVTVRVASRFVQPLLFDLTPGDPVTAIAAAWVLVLVAMGAGWLPARRAARIDPIVALRAE